MKKLIFILLALFYCIIFLPAVILYEKKNTDTKASDIPSIPAAVIPASTDSQPGAGEEYWDAELMPVPLRQNHIIKDNNYDEIINSDIKKTVILSINNKIVSMDLEEYIKGVIAAEMPGSYNIEALKAQAVAARTFTAARIQKTEGDSLRHPEAHVCSNPSHCQAYTDFGEYKEKYPEHGTNIEKSVNETKNIILSYNGYIVNALYHDSSGRSTENADEVWNIGKIPYLSGVDNREGDGESVLKTEKVFSKKDFINTLKQKFNDLVLDENDPFKSIKILSKTSTERVYELSIGNINVKAADLRFVLGLNSTDFTVKEDEEKNIIFSITGNGHGVGLSQRGANQLANKGKMFDEILKFYYSGVEISSIE